MRTSLLLACLALGILCFTGVQSARAQGFGSDDGFDCAEVASNRVGELRRINLEKAHSKAYEVHVGDLIQCYHGFNVLPEEIIDDLRVQVRGSSLRLVVVVDTGSGALGHDEISAYLLVTRTGRSRVEIKTVIPGGTSNVYKLIFDARAAIRETPRPEQGAEATSDDDEENSSSVDDRGGNNYIDLANNSDLEYVTIVLTTDRKGQHYRLRRGESRRISRLPSTGFGAVAFDPDGWRIGGDAFNLRVPFEVTVESDSEGGNRLQINGLEFGLEESRTEAIDSPPAERYSYQNSGYCYFTIGFLNDRRKGQALCLIPAANNGSVRSTDLSFVQELEVDGISGWVFMASGFPNTHKAIWIASEPNSGTTKFTIRNSVARNRAYRESDFNNVYVANADQQLVEQ